MRILGAECLGAAEPGAAIDDESAACLLLRRFQQHGDAEAFALLCEIVREPLRERAARIARERGDVEPDALVTALLARVFRHWRSPSLLVLSFFPLADALMRRHASRRAAPPGGERVRA